MRTLLSADPFLPPEARSAVSQGRLDAREQLVRLGANDCEAAELLDTRCAPVAADRAADARELASH